MAPPGVGENGITSESPKSPRRFRAVEAAEAKPAPRTPQRPLHNLPLEVSSFVGREKELTEVKRLQANNRLLTLTGSGVAARPGWLWPWQASSWKGSRTACGWWIWPPWPILLSCHRQWPLLWAFASSRAAGLPKPSLATSDRG